ncbi:MAG: amidophosphoribosyltransferase [Candidatus Buchananbacteria bacterium]|nr:amidophosphoribosyltransferase [Candidatus Buchananbacteria bacterium]
MCGIFGAYNCHKAAETCYVMGHAIQHRATKYAGIVSSDGTNIFCYKNEGIIQDVFDQEILDELHGTCAVGHIRYATVEDDPSCDNAQPILGVFEGQEIAIAHNGNLTNCDDLRKLLKDPSDLKTKMDTEIILRLLCQSQAPTLVEKIYDSVRYLKGTYSLLIIFSDTIIAVRDPWGNRPLSVGVDGGSLFFASETIAFESLGVETEREIYPGEIFITSKGSCQSYYFDEFGLSHNPLKHPLAHCIFELIYYSHPGSVVFGEPVVDFHLRAGKKLCQKCPAAANCVVGVPDSAVYHAEGYADEKGISPTRGITRHHYIGRTFILPFQRLRDLAVRKKFIIIRQLVKGKDVVLVDDSIVRLTTMRGLVGLLRSAGAKSIHLRIVAPMIISPCYYGIDTPNKSELIAANHSKEEIRQICGADSLEFLSLDDLKSLVSNPQDYCFACMTGEYPI